MDTAPATAGTPPRARGFIAASIYLFEKLMPDPFTLAIGITVLVAVASLLFAPRASPGLIVTAWHDGVFSILTFTFQTVLVLVSGHALAHAPPVQRGFRALLGLARTPNQAVALTFLSVAVASFFNWGFGLVISALLAREVARRMPVDFAWLVAASFSGWVVWASGPSSSIALAQSTPGSAMNVVQKLTGQVLPFSETVFTTFNIVPTLVVMAVMPFVFMALRPRDADIVAFDPSISPDAPERPRPPRATMSFAQRLNYSPVGSVLFVLAGLAWIVMGYFRGALTSDINTVIFFLLVAGVGLHGHPLAYADAVRNGAKQTGSMMLQYPLYGGIMGIMAATGLPGVISDRFVAISSAHSLPFWTYVSSMLITFLIPSGGGHWAVQGPFVIPAAVALHASIPAVTMSVAMGEEVSNMMQPFWAVPVVAMAGIGIQRVLGYTVVTFAVAAVIYGAALLLLV